MGASEGPHFLLCARPGPGELRPGLTPAEGQNGGSSLNWPACLPLVLLARSGLAVAHFRLGPASSAVTSTTERLSPSGVSQARMRSWPVTITRSPLLRESPRCSASCRQAVIRKNDVSPSRQLSPSRTLGVTA